MNKSILTLVLTGVLISAGTVFVFANENKEELGSRNNNNIKIQKLGSDIDSFDNEEEEMLRYKYERVDEAVKSGEITKERGEEIKEEILRNPEFCDFLGENSEKNRNRSTRMYGMKRRGNC